MDQPDSLMNSAPNKVPMIGQDGAFYEVPESNAGAALKSGFRIASAEELNKAQLESQYGEGVSNELKAGAEGFARTASFGLSDQILTRSGLTTPEALAARKEFNPYSSATGEIAGVVAPALLTGGSTAPASAASQVARAASAPVRGVIEAGQAVAKAATPAAERLAGAIVSKEASPAINAIISRGAAQGLGSAVEGAAFGLGQSISEDALGDPDLNAEKVLSNIGFNALIGGGFGAVFGGATAAIERAGAKVPTVARMIEKEPETLDEALTATAVSSTERKSLLDGFRKLKDNAKDIDQASLELGVPTFIPQKSASDTVLRAHEVMSNGLTKVGIQERQAINEAFNKVGSEVETVLKREGVGSLAETGEQLKSSLVSKFEAEYAPTKALYEELEQYGSAIPVTNRSTGAIARNVRDIIKQNAIVKGTPAYNFIESVADSLSQVTDLNYLRNLRTNIRKQAPIDAKWVAGDIIERLDNLETNAIKRFASTMKTEKASKRILDLLDTSETAKSNYRKLYERMGEFGDVLGKSKIRGPQDFLDFLSDGNTAERFAEKLFQKKNSAFTEFFQANFPNEWKIVADYQKNKLLEGALKDGQVNIRAVTKKVFDLEPELRKALFSEPELKKLAAAKTWVEAFPAKFNPSGTSAMMGVTSFLENPATALKQNIRDAIIKQGFERLGLTSESAANIQILSKIERAANDITRQVQSGARSIFVVAKGAAQATAAEPKVALKYDDATVKEVNEMVEKPEKLLEKLEQSSQWVYNVAPKTAGSMQMASMRAVTFLQSKLPKNPDPKPLGPKFVPSPAEMSKFNRYYKALQNPTGVLKSVKMGMLSSEEMETLQTVYPSLLSSMQAAVMEQLSDKMASDKASDIPYSTKLSLSMFLGQDLMPSLEPENIIAMQKTLLGNGQEQARAEQERTVKMSQAGLSNLSLSQRAKTNLQSIASGGEA